MTQPIKLSVAEVGLLRERYKQSAEIAPVLDQLASTMRENERLRAVLEEINGEQSCGNFTAQQALSYKDSV